jgi:alkylhydroperoxidase/carboxymuconolactone decarboxylase family protein YurZ
MSALGPEEDRASADAMNEAASEDVNPMPPSVQAQLAELDPRFARFMVMQSRMRRDHLTSLTQRERGMISMTADIMYQTLGQTFRAHAGRAFRGGADRETLREVVCFNAPYGVTRVWNALAALNGFIDSLGA